MEIKNTKFWDKVLVKLIETIISIKVITVFSVLIISTYLLLSGFIDGTIWGTVNAGVISTVYALREAVKIAHVNQKKNNE